MEEPIAHFVRSDKDVMLAGIVIHSIVIFDNRVEIMVEIIEIRIETQIEAPTEEVVCLQARI